MLKLEEITVGAEIAGLLQNELATIVAVNKVGDNAVTVYYKTHSGAVQEQLLFREMKRSCRSLKPDWLGLLSHPVKISNWL